MKDEAADDHLSNPMRQTLLRLPDRMLTK